MPAATEATDAVSKTIRALREASLVVLRTSGWTGTTRGRTPVRATRGEVGGIQIVCNTPFTPRLGTTELGRHGLAQASRCPLLPYALDIWDRRRKKLSVSWDHDDGGLEVMTLKRGQWNSRLLEFAARLSGDVGTVR